MGAFLRNKERLRSWERALQKMAREKSLDGDKEIWKTLQISYDGLSNDVEKGIFLDVACFFCRDLYPFGISKETILSMWAKDGILPMRELERLIDMSLLKVNKDGDILEMHDQLRDMGRKIAKDTRIWKASMIPKSGFSSKDVEVLEGISLQGTMIHHLPLLKQDQSFDFKKLRILILVSDLRSLEVCVANLDFLLEIAAQCSQLEAIIIRSSQNLLGFPRSLPTNIAAILSTKISNLCDTCASLKIFDLIGLEFLKYLPNKFASNKTLLRLNLSSCSSLVSLSKEVGNLSSLTTLNLSGCSSLEALPSEVGNLSSLTTLKLWGCSSLEALPSEVGNLSSLTTLDLSFCSSLKALPSEVGNLSSLITFNLDGCSNLSTLPKEVEISSSLTTFNLEEHSSKGQIQTIRDDKHVLKKQWQEAIVIEFDAKYDLSKHFNNAIQEPLLKLLSFLTTKGLHVLGSLLLWVQTCTGMCSQQVLSWNKGKVESKNLLTKRFLGQGCSGIFYETTWSASQRVKFARKDFPEVPGDIFAMEAIQLFELRDHPNIVKTFCWTVDNRSCSLVTEYMKDDLSSFMRKKKEALRKKGDQSVIGVNPSLFQLPEALHILLQIAMGVEYIHDKGIYHGDLKPNNVFLDWKEGQMLVKVADFGLLETKRNSTLLSQRALCFRMIEWSAPELFEEYFTSMSEDLDFLWTTSLKTELDPSSSSASSSKNHGQEVVMEKADSYSFALTSAYVLGGEQMWPAKLSPQELRKRISCRGLRPKLPSGCPETLKSLIHACWNPDPTCRPTFSTIRSTMQDIIKE